MAINEQSNSAPGKGGGRRQGGFGGPGGRERNSGRRDRRREPQARDISNWIPKTALGKRVLNGEITSLDQVLETGKRVLEPEIVDFLFHGSLKDEVLQISSTQRMTAYGRKQLMRAVVLIGNEGGYVGVGVGKAAESRDAIEEAIIDAKKNLVRIPLGCGSWECGCGKPHSLTQTIRGGNGSTEVTIKPAPRGVGLVAGEVSRKVLNKAGIKDAWTFAKGRTRNILNTVLATIAALDSLNKLKKGT